MAAFGCLANIHDVVVKARLPMVMVAPCKQLAWYLASAQFVTGHDN
jgi:hypothetical protein